MSNVLFPTLTAQKVVNIWPTTQGIVDEGTYFVATNPTVGTGIATTTSVVDDGNSGSTSAQTRPLMIIQNQYAPGDPNAKNIYPLNLNLQVTGAPTSATYWQCAMHLDVAGSNRYTSGGSVITPVNVNGAASGASRAAIYFGAITAAAATASAKLVFNHMVNPTIPVVKDTMIIAFGSTTDGNYANVTSVNKTVALSAPPIVIGPGQFLVIEMWGASNAAAPAFEFQLDYVER